MGNMVRFLSGSPISHTVLALGHGRVMDVWTNVGVEECSVDEAFGAGVMVAITLRRRGADAAMRAEVCRHARSFAGRPYDDRGAWGAGMFSSQVMSRAVCVAVPGVCDAIRENASEQERDLRFFCSEHIARSFELAGLRLFDREASFAMPDHVYRASTLEYVAHIRLH